MRIMACISLSEGRVLELSTLTRNWLSATYARQEYELKLQAAGAQGDAIIRIDRRLTSAPRHEHNHARN
jgi:hypothetical protein